MLGFIGFIVVAWIAWSALKVFTRNAAVATMQRAEHYAVSQGVPRAFARGCVDDAPRLKALRASFAASEKDFGALDVYQQYGRAIVEAYHFGELEDQKNTMQAVLARQVRELEAEDVVVLVTETTFAYVVALGLAIGKRPVTLEQALEVVRQVFPSAEDRPIVNNAYGNARSCIDLFESAAKLIPDAKGDLTATEGGSFVRLAKHLHRTLVEPAMQGAEFDPNLARSALDVENI